MYRASSTSWPPRRTEAFCQDIRKLFCRSAAVLGPPSSRTQQNVRDVLHSLLRQTWWVLIDGGGRGRTPSDRRAFVYQFRCFCSTGRPTTDSSFAMNGV